MTAWIVVGVYGVGVFLTLIIANYLLRHRDWGADMAVGYALMWPLLLPLLLLEGLSTLIRRIFE